MSPKDGVALVSKNKYILAKGQIKYFEGNYALLEFSDISHTRFSDYAITNEEVALLIYHNF